MSTLGSVIIRDVIANRPSASIAGRIFIASDTGGFYRDNGASWDVITVPTTPTGLVLIEEHDASSSATLNFTTRNANGLTGATFQTDFDTYKIEIVNIVPATNATSLQMRMSTDGGSTYDSGSNYEWKIWRWVSVATGFSGSTSSTLIQVTDSGDTASNSSSWGIVASLSLYSPASSSLFKMVHGQYSLISGSTPEGAVISGTYKISTAVNAVRFLMSSGNMASGSIRIYGVSK